MDRAFVPVLTEAQIEVVQVHNLIAVDYEDYNLQERLDRIAQKITIKRSTYWSLSPRAKAYYDRLARGIEDGTSTIRKINITEEKGVNYGN